MKRESFADSHPGRLVETRAILHDGSTVGTLAYVPGNLPPVADFDHPALQEQTERSLLALGELRGLIPALPNPKLISEPFLRREAVLSSRIEGTRTEIEGLLLFETARSEQIDQTGNAAEQLDAREVANYVDALHYGLNRIRRMPICLRVLKEMHAILLSEVGDDRVRYCSPGRFRRSLAFIGRTGDVRDASYVAPPASEIDWLMDDLERFIHQTPVLSTLAHLAIVHYQFEAIHPFVVGNGRLGRLLIPLFLCEKAILPEPLLYLSAYFERNRSDYYKRLFDVSARGEWNEWILFFLQGVESEARDACDRAKALLGLREEYRSLIQADTRTSNLLSLVDALFEWPVTSYKMAERKLGLTYMGAKYNVDKLAEAGILTETTGRYRNRIFVAKRIIELMS